LLLLRLLSSRISEYPPRVPFTRRTPPLSRIVQLSAPRLTIPPPVTQCVTVSHSKGMTIAGDLACGLPRGQLPFLASRRSGSGFGGGLITAPPYRLPRQAQLLEFFCLLPLNEFPLLLFLSFPQDPASLADSFEHTRDALLFSIPSFHMVIPLFARKDPH